MAKKGQWVQIHEIVLAPADRAAQVPADTKLMPLEMWVKGYLEHDAQLDEVCEIKTVTGRIVKGRLVDIEPVYIHGFGSYVDELGKIRDQVRDILA